MFIKIYIFQKFSRLFFNNYAIFLYVNFNSNIYNFKIFIFLFIKLQSNTHKKNFIKLILRIK